MSNSLELQIAHLEAELAALRSEMQTFTATVSHDLRAPLRHIVSYAALVQEDAGPQLSAEVRGFLNTITDAAGHLSLMLDALTALSRVGSVALSQQPVSLQALMQEITRDLTLRHPQQAIKWVLAEDLPTLSADLALLRLALEPLLANAVKFSRLREVSLVELVANVDATNRLITLRVQDNGVGFNPALNPGLMQPGLFQPFVQLHRNTQFEGLGVGLALSSRALARMGGTLALNATPGGGCCATVVFAA